MPVICIGPVCIPLNLFLPFLVTLLHKAGYLKWVKPEWFTIRHWSNRYSRWRHGDKAEVAVTAPTNHSTVSCSSSQPGSEPAACSSVQLVSSSGKQEAHRSADGLHKREGHGHDNTGKGPDTIGKQ